MKKISNPFNSKNSSDNFGIFLLIMSYQFALIGLNGIPIISSSLKDYFEVKNSLIMIAVFGVPAASVILLAVPIGSLSTFDAHCLELVWHDNWVATKYIAYFITHGTTPLTFCITRFSYSHDLRCCCSAYSV